jgi:hypothetical protein
VQEKVHWNLNSCANVSFGVKSSRMGRAAIAITAFMTVLSLAACDQKEEDYQISAVGYWRGHADGFQAAILNRENGSSRFYFKIPGKDTANSTLKVEGTYKHANDAFKGKYPSANDTMSVECTFISEQAMFGFMTLISADPVSIDLERQP